MRFLSFLLPTFLMTFPHELPPDFNAVLQLNLCFLLYVTSYIYVNSKKPVHFLLRAPPPNKGNKRKK